MRAVFLDADDVETWETARRYLAGLGYMPDGDYPLVATASGTGRHVYMTLADSIGGDWKRLRRTFGNGELRFGSGSYIVGVGSVVNGREYTMLAGDPRQLPRMERADLRELADIDADAGPALRPSVPGIPRGAAALLAGRHVERYQTRSEAEMALITGLVNSGHDFGGVLVLFQTHPCAGKYAELRETRGDREALRWLRRSYDAAARWAEAHESEGRKVARTALAWAQSVAWPGRTGNSDKATFRAHCAIAWRSARLTYQAGTREIAELASVAFVTAHKANHRLQDAGLVRCEKTNVGTLATMYALGDVRSYITPSQINREGVIQLCTRADARKDATGDTNMSEDDVIRLAKLMGHDAFRHRGLGKSAWEVWYKLMMYPSMTAAELAASTGRHVSTVKRVLSRMERIVDPITGEVFKLVEPGDGDTWKALDGDLDGIARAIGTAGAGDRQKAKHEREREGWKRAIDRQRAGNVPRKAR